MKSLFKLYFQTIKIYSIPSAIILFSVFLFFQVLLPQFYSIQEKKSNMEKEEEKANELEASLNFLKTSNESKVDKDFEIIKSALPNSKDILSIFIALNTASSKSKVALGSFSFSPGNIYSKKKNKEISDISSIRIQINATAVRMSDLIKFCEEMYGIFPIAEITSFSVTNTSGEFMVEFYYKERDLSAFETVEKVSPLTSKQNVLLQKLSKWTEE